MGKLEWDFFFGTEEVTHCRVTHCRLKVSDCTNEDGTGKELSEVAKHLVSTTKVHSGAITRVFAQKFPAP